MQHGSREWAYSSVIVKCTQHIHSYNDRYDVTFCRKANEGNTLQYLSLRLFNVLLPSAKNVANTHFKKIILE
jgi:hypothetical protein